MAPATVHSQILKKRYCSSYDSYYDDCYSTWNDWGRWVALAVIVVAVLLVAFLFSCYNNRRRRRMGAQPMYGTGWIPGSKPPPQYGQHTQDYYPNQPYNGGAPAPPYSAPPVGNQNTGTTFNSNDGYYGGHNNFEMQPPQNTYQPQRGGEPVYEAPMGPPPGKAAKGDDIIR